MMDPANIRRAAELYAEMRQIERAVEVIDANGTIIAVTLESADLHPDPDSPIHVTITVPTEGLQYPPQMVAAIKAQLEERRTAINHELSDIGVTPMLAR
jgi:hypothetical protein